MMAGPHTTVTPQAWTRTHGLEELSLTLTPDGVSIHVGDEHDAVVLPWHELETLLPWLQQARYRAPMRRPQSCWDAERRQYNREGT